MCDDHGQVREGPTRLIWGQTACTFALVASALGALASWGDLSSVTERIVGMAAGPVLALAGWSLAEFIRGEADGVPARFAAVALIVSGALAGMSALDRSDTALLGAITGTSWQVWFCAGTVALGLAVARHPLYGRALGWSGTTLSVLVAMWVGGGFGPLEWVHPILGPVCWYLLVIVRTAIAVRRMRMGYAGWPEPALA